MIALSITSITDHINTLKSLPTQKYSRNSPDPTNVVLANNKVPPLDIGHSAKIGDVWTLKH